MQFREIEKYGASLEPANLVLDECSFVPKLLV
jgi:hypothetical protein